MSSLSKVALFGAGGTNIGYHLIRTFLADDTFEVTVLARSGSTTSYPPAVELVKINDFEDHEELVQALKGQDVLISCVGPGAFAVQNHLVEACLEAEVTRFIPTEWGFDNDDPACRELCPSVFGAKGKFVDEVLRPKEGNLEWTAVASSIWLDWALDTKFLGIDPETHTVRYWRDGSAKWSATTLPYTAAAVVQILRNPHDTANKRIFLSPFETSQREVVAELERRQGVEYNVIPFDADEEVAAAKKKWITEKDMGSIYVTIPAAVLLAEYEAAFQIAAKSPIAEKMESLKLPQISAAEVVQGWVGSIDSVKT
ncbi:hypothetical protein KC367_g8196 [Hortaea werneckii]|uniref:NmrA-like domain-containing protein n=1 Tax=Hortaea werneckii EXF-2000 TaxID=1157616 RepID=A0A1Z5SN52_HORWE|nr:hypothetical protein KC358_g15324 [Hortaea werneckii]OTA22272.1 hypothetical protein BTJ68_14922 [Hortaea werneckii EXF-2000]KAI6906453.1 hypothetical protein KC348_g14643 [Hortaea werneckii]KAI6923518.1 hypothetical protein KC341_g14665 [Hortaea werneckii]KAI6956932.1 hypothetical protein KC321_g14884 [Hortaea werneckii]